MCMYVVLSTMRQIYVFNYSMFFFYRERQLGKSWDIQVGIGLGYPGWDLPGISRLGSAWDSPVGIGLE